MQQIIARGTVHAFVKQKKKFSLKNVHNEILRRGGILRVSMGVTISEYLNDLENKNIIKYDNQLDEYIVC